MITCVICGAEYSINDRKGKPGLVKHCNECAEENVDRYTGNMIYDHKTGCSIQINSDPGLTQYIINSTKLRNKGSNLGNNLKVSYRTKGAGRCLLTATPNTNAKGKNT